MAYSGKDLYDFVIRLNREKASFNHSQGLYRAIVSRAYYSAFLEARDYLGISEDEKKAIHTLVCNQLKNKDLQLGNKLFDLLRKRKKADYKVSVSCASRDVAESVRLAGEIINALNTATQT